MKAIVVLTAAPDIKSAQRIAQDLVQNRLAACVSVFPGVRSTYRWKKKIETAQETLLLIKTSKRHVKVLESRFKKHHPYDLPEFLVLPVMSGSRAYLSWLDKSVRI